MPETLTGDELKELFVVGVAYRGVMGVSTWSAPPQWRTEHALVLGVPLTQSCPLVSFALAKLGATAERLPPEIRHDRAAAFAEAERRQAHLVLCYWRPEATATEAGPVLG